MKKFICTVIVVAALAQLLFAFNASATESVCPVAGLRIFDAVSYGNHYYLAGSKNDDAAVVCFNFDNEIVWEACFGGSDYDCFMSIAVKNDMVVTAGWSISKDGDMKDICFGVEENPNDYYDWKKDAVVTAFSASDGKLLWKRGYGGTHYDEFADVAIIDSGDIVVVGNTRSKDCNAENATNNNSGMFNFLLSIIRPNGKEKFSYCMSSCSALNVSQWGNKFYYSTYSFYRSNSTYYLFECVDGEYYKCGKYHSSYNPLMVDDRMYWIDSRIVEGSNKNEKRYLSLCNEDDLFESTEQTITHYDLNCVFNNSILSIQKQSGGYFVFGSSSGYEVSRYSSTGNCFVLCETDESFNVTGTTYLDLPNEIGGMLLINDKPFFWSPNGVFRMVAMRPESAKEKAYLNNQFADNAGDIIGLTIVVFAFVFFVVEKVVHINVANQRRKRKAQRRAQKGNNFASSFVIEEKSSMNIAQYIIPAAVLIIVFAKNSSYFFSSGSFSFAIALSASIKCCLFTAGSWLAEHILSFIVYLIVLPFDKYRIHRR